MSFIRSLKLSLLAGVAGSMMIASGAQADPPVLETMLLQGLSNSPPEFPGLYWNPASTSQPVIDDSGKVAFTGQIFGDGIVPANNRVWWYGEAGNWTVVARNSLATLPGLSGGPYTFAALANASPAISPNGMFTVSGQIAGAGVTTADDTAVWIGNAGSHTLIGRESTTALPGGAILTGSMSLTSGGRSNNAGQLVFGSALANGDTITTGPTANNSGVFLLSPTGLTTVWRKGTPAPGAPPQTIGDEGPFLTPNTSGMHLNGSGNVLMTGSLVAGTAGGVTTNDDSVIFVVEGGLPRIVAREGAVLPSIANDPAITNVVYKSTGSFTLATRALNNSGLVMFNAQLADVPPGTTITLANDFIWLADVDGVMTKVLREGDPLGAGTFNNVNLQAIHLNNNGRVAFAASLLPTGNAMFEGPIGGPYTQILATGEALPGHTDVFFSSSFYSGGAMAYNNANQIVFNCDVTGAGVTPFNNRTIMTWDAVNGLRLVARTGVTTIPGLLDIAGISLMGSTGVTGECGAANFTDTGLLTFIASDVKGLRAIMRTDLSSEPVCLADIDDSGAVDINDLLDVINNWGACANPNDCPQDVDGDDQIDINDLLEVINGWGDCP